MRCKGNNIFICICSTFFLHLFIIWPANARILSVLISACTTHILLLIGTLSCWSSRLEMCIHHFTGRLTFRLFQVRWLTSGTSVCWSKLILLLNTRAKQEHPWCWYLVEVKWVLSLLEPVTGTELVPEANHLFGCDKTIDSDNWHFD